MINDLKLEKSEMICKLLESIFDQYLFNYNCYLNYNENYIKVISFDDNRMVWKYRLEDDMMMFENEISIGMLCLFYDIAGVINNIKNTQRLNYVWEDEE